MRRPVRLRLSVEDQRVMEVGGYVPRSIKVAGQECRVNVRMDDDVPAPTPAVRDGELTIHVPVELNLCADSRVYYLSLAVWREQFPTDIELVMESL